MSNEQIKLRAEAKRLAQSIFETVYTANTQSRDSDFDIEMAAKILLIALLELRSKK